MSDGLWIVYIRRDNGIAIIHCESAYSGKDILGIGTTESWAVDRRISAQSAMEESWN